MRSKEYNGLDMPKIQWNKVTWYSKTLALVIFIVLPFIFFYYGVQYGILLQLAKDATQATATHP